MWRGGPGDYLYQRGLKSKGDPRSFHLLLPSALRDTLLHENLVRWTVKPSLMKASYLSVAVGRVQHHTLIKKKINYPYI